eukprot:286699-Pelagomonas_calceolata.AAC.2
MHTLRSDHQEVAHGQQQTMHSCKTAQKQTMLKKGTPETAHMQVHRKGEAEHASAGPLNLTRRQDKDEWCGRSTLLEGLLQVKGRRLHKTVPQAWLSMDGKQRIIGTQFRQRES